MFSCARVRDDLIIQINFKRFLIACASSLFVITMFLWIAWVIVVKIEAARLRSEIYQSVSGALSAAIQQSFDKNHSSLLKLEDCQTRLKHSQAASSDLAKMVNKKLSDNDGVLKLLEGSEEVPAPPKGAKSKAR